MTPTIETVAVIGTGVVGRSWARVFSRAGCDAAVEQCQQANLRLTSPDERSEIRAYVEERGLPIGFHAAWIPGHQLWR